MKQWKGYQKGINFGGWFSQCDHTEERYDTFITKEDVKRVAGWGLDHVRIPVDYNLVEEEGGAYRETGFARLQKAIDWCGEYGLHMILDLHKTAGYSFDEGEQEDGFFEQAVYQERFYRLWEEFARRFGKYQDRLAFELLNEVTDREYMERWNAIADQCIYRIRQIAPNIDILVGGYWNNSVAAVGDLAIPQDSHIIYNFHCYDPLLFTHQGAGWVSGMPQDFRFAYGQSYAAYDRAKQKLFPDLYGYLPKMEDPEQQFGADFFRALFADAVHVAERRNVALYCGEYGVIDRAEAEDALRWFQAIHTVFEEFGIGRAAWNYRGMNYGLVEEHFSGVLGDVIPCL